MYFCFVSGDVEVLVNSDHIRTIKSIGNRLTITTDCGTRTYDSVFPTPQWEKRLKLMGPQEAFDAGVNERHARRKAAAEAAEMAKAAQVCLAHP
jgi:hypothetical protein